MSNVKNYLLGINKEERRDTLTKFELIWKKMGRWVISGGHFDYNQYKIGYIADQIEQTIIKNGVKKTPEEIKDGWHNDEWYEKYPEDLFNYKYPDEVIEKMKEAVKALKIAQEYAQRVDWLLSGDDGEESFLSRLEENLKKIE